MNSEIDIKVGETLYVIYSGMIIPMTVCLPYMGIKSDEYALYYRDEYALYDCVAVINKSDIGTLAFRSIDEAENAKERTDKDL